MTFDYFGAKRNASVKFNDFVDFISSKNQSGWEHFGMDVELDPTVDFKNENIKIRWTDINEGFCDKVIVKSKEEFLSMFKRIA